MDARSNDGSLAELVADDKNKPPVPVAAGCDPELERQLLEFEMRRYEEEKEESVELNMKLRCDGKRENYRFRWTVIGCIGR